MSEQERCRCVIVERSGEIRNTLIGKVGCVQASASYAIQGFLSVRDEVMASALETTCTRLCAAH